MPCSDRLETFIHTHLQTLYRAALSVTGNVPDAEDAVQEACLRFLERPPRCSQDAELKAWLLRVTVNAAIDTKRERARHPREELLDIYPAPDGETRKLMSTILELPPRERAAVYLFYYEGYSTEETAHILHCRPGTARSLLSRAREHLRRKLKGEIEL